MVLDYKLFLGSDRGWDRNALNEVSQFSSSQKEENWDSTI
ncbi:hypothetical protein BACCELL_00712 [Bacteroides cellulosilyticus DSM 14838]|uniref:Uncharacterized protein n=1 Tax=Bacteroides cellulosilyticus DSM 14838 TaxID=537012 RepID=E2N8W7_9BACE|nr:hypothetical protein BACCELL_00712 [Bacteroides cellulosilyticus DSM 14838]